MLRVDPSTESLPGSQAEQASQQEGTARARRAGLPSAGARILKLFEEIEEERKKDLSEKLAEPEGAQQTAGGSGLFDVEWIGGYRGVDLAIDRRRLTGITIEQRGSLIRFPRDAEVLYKETGAEAYGDPRGPEEPMEVTKMQKPLGTGQLLPDGPGVNWEHWFRAFEDQAAQKKVPLEQWPDLLRWQVSPALRGEVETAIGTCLREAKIPPRRLYAAVRDELLEGCGVKYDAWTYFRRIVEMTPGARSAQDLAKYLKELAQDYEAARKRASLRLYRLSELSGYSLALIYHSKLKDETRRQLPRPSELPFSFTGSAFTTLVGKAMRLEAAEQPLLSEDVPKVAAVVTADENKDTHEAGQSGGKTEG